MQEMEDDDAEEGKEPRSSIDNYTGVSIKVYSTHFYGNITLSSNNLFSGVLQFKARRGATYTTTLWRPEVSGGSGNWCAWLSAIDVCHYLISVVSL
jgi:hypothetical protein